MEEFGFSTTSSNNQTNESATWNSSSTPSHNNDNVPSETPSANPNAIGNRRQRLRQKLQSQLQVEQLQKRRQQAGNAIKNFGSQLQKINLAKLIDQMEQDQGLADSLEQLNERMKEECERHEVRREAEARTLEVIQDHLDVFLQEYPQATYEDWIQDLHPENANQGKLLADIQEIDPRFYVYESDHRRLWNEAMDKLEDNAHRHVAARTQIWGKASSGNINENIDLISGSGEFQTYTQDNNNYSTGNETPSGDLMDFSAGGDPSDNNETKPEATKNEKQEDEPSEDLIKF